VKAHQRAPRCDTDSAGKRTTGEGCNEQQGERTDSRRAIPHQHGEDIMRVLTALRNVVASAGFLAALSPAALQAQQRTLFTWTGRADQTVDVTIRGSSVRQRLLAASQARGNGRTGGTANISLQSALPSQDGTVRLTTSGNQQASVIEQPSSSNNYTAIIRLGGGNSRGNGGQVTAYWSPSSNYGNGRYDRDSNVGRDRRGNGTTNNNGGYGNNNGSYGNASNALHWYGDVDGVTQLTLRGAQLSIRNVASGSRNVAGNEAGVTLPSRPVTVGLNIREGRGNVTVIQQPTSANGYTAIVRIVDSPSGFGHYDFDITWR
jgi:hypothetical protein